MNKNNKVLIHFIFNPVFKGTIMSNVAKIALGVVGVVGVAVVAASNKTMDIDAHKASIDAKMAARSASALVQDIARMSGNIAKSVYTSVKTGSVFR